MIWVCSPSLVQQTCKVGARSFDIQALFGPINRKNSQNHSKKTFSEKIQSVRSRAPDTRLGQFFDFYLTRHLLNTIQKRKVAKNYFVDTHDMLLSCCVTRIPHFDLTVLVTPLVATPDTLQKVAPTPKDYFHIVSASATTCPRVVYTMRAKSKHCAFCMTKKIFNRSQLAEK